jgi:hypothetical protein
MALPYPFSTDPANVPSDILALATAVNTQAAGYVAGASTSPPSTTYEGLIWFQTDTLSLWYYSTAVTAPYASAGWRPIGNQKSWATLDQNSNAITATATLGGIATPPNVTSMIPLAAANVNAAASADGFIINKTSGGATPGFMVFNFAGRYQIEFGAGVGSATGYVSAANGTFGAALCQLVSSGSAWTLKKRGSITISASTTATRTFSTGSCILSLSAGDSLGLGFVQSLGTTVTSLTVSSTAEPVNYIHATYIGQ